MIHQAADQRRLGRAGFEHLPEIHARELLKLKQKLNELLAKHSGKKLAQLEKDTDRDNLYVGRRSAEIRLDRPGGAVPCQMGLNVNGGVVQAAFRLPEMLWRHGAVVNCVFIAIAVTVAVC